MPTRSEPPRSEPPYYLSFFLFTTDPQPGDPQARERLLGQIEALVAQGYGGFELPIPPPPPGVDPEDQVEAYRQLRSAVDDRGLAAVAFTTNVAATARFDPTHPDPAVRQAALAYLSSRVAITAALRGTVMMGPIVFPYGQRPSWGGETLWSDGLQAGLAEGYARAAGVLAELARRAAAVDVRLAIEPITHWETAAPNTLEQLLAFLDLVPDPQLGVVIDSAHEVLDGAGPEVFATQVAALAAAGRLHYVQLSAPDRGRLDRCWLPWEPFLAAVLPHYDGPLAIEMFNALPVFQPLLRLTRAKYWIEGVDGASEAPSALAMAEASLGQARRQVAAALARLAALALCLLLLLGDAGPAAAAGGSWQAAPLPPEADRMQAVHSVLLPNGKVLLVNGSSFRTEHDGAFDESLDLAHPGWTDNSGLWDPATGTLQRIGSPEPMLFDPTIGASGAMTPNDLFCSGHLQLPDGNVLFAGGTGSYYPGGAFTGSKWLNLYDWKRNTWRTVGRMAGGRWYPTLLQLASGRVAIIGGLDFDEPNQLNTSLEIYDPASGALQAIDLTTVEGSPFNTRVVGDDVYDTIDLYPRIFPLADGRFLITGDEAGIEGVLVPHRSRNTYLMTIDEGSEGVPASVHFAAGPLRHETNRAYGTAVQVPGAEDVLLIGGIVGSNSISFGREGRIDRARFPGVSVSRTLQRWSPGPDGGQWTSTADVLPTPRANLQAVILPTRQLLVLNGGVFPEYQPQREPLLLTPDTTAPGGYRVEPQPPATLPRLYHNGALLLPDGRVLSTGGNANRASHTETGLRVDVLGDPQTLFRFPTLRNGAGDVEPFDVDTYYADPQHYVAEGGSEPFVPAEIWRSEVFSPPYLAQEGPRPAIRRAPAQLRYGERFNVELNGGDSATTAVLVKLGSVTHSFDFGQRLAPLEPDPTAAPVAGRLALQAPTNPHLAPPGYYMLFCLNGQGVPSPARMVQLGGAGASVT